MHEVGIVSGILQTVLSTAREAQVSRVVSVTLRLGDMREVVPEALSFAWETLREDDPLTAQAQLVTEDVHPRSLCLTCGAEFDHDRFHCRCPQCGGAETQLVHGRELDLVNMVVE